jgi:uncharacterized membrane protein YcjF (UPF0283 family)
MIRQVLDHVAEGGRRGIGAVDVQDVLGHSVALQLSTAQIPHCGKLE